MIQIDHLAKRFTSAGSTWWRANTPIQAIEDINIHAPNGHILGLLGPNGAGKTTTVRTLVGLIKPDAGNIHIDGMDIKQHPRQKTLQYIGLLTDSAGLYPRLTARENLLYFGSLHGLEKTQANTRMHHLARQLDMTHLLDRRTEGFSQGERMKTALARALIHDPANIVLDEPTNGLDVLSTRALRNTLRHLSSTQGGNKCIIFSTHIMQEVEQLCDSVVVVAQGRTVAQGTVAQLMDQTKQSNFENAFIQLAYPDKVDHHLPIQKR
jgi:sodium transport system ATP-binding protein